VFRRSEVKLGTFPPIKFKAFPYLSFLTKAPPIKVPHFALKITIFDLCNNTFISHENVVITDPTEKPYQT
jgi:hypothetical protein